LNKTLLHQKWPSEISQQKFLPNPYSFASIFIAFKTVIMGQKFQEVLQKLDHMITQKTPTLKNSQNTELQLSVLLPNE
jgi:hypothetical protein